MYTHNIYAYTCNYIYILFTYIHIFLPLKTTNMHHFQSLHLRQPSPAAFTGWIMPRCRCKIHQSTTSIEDQVAIIVIQKNDLSHFFFVSRNKKKMFKKGRPFWKILLCLEVTCGRWFVEEVEKTWGNNCKLILSDTLEWFGQIHFE